MNAPLVIEESSTMPKITGYRKLNHIELNLINTIKEQGQMLEQMVLMVVMHLDEQFHTTDPTDVDDDADPFGFERTEEQEQELARINKAEPQRWAGIARAHFQQGLMALTRAIAQPSTF